MFFTQRLLLNCYINYNILSRFIILVFLILEKQFIHMFIQILLIKDKSTKTRICVQAQLQWPTGLSLSPLDGSLHFIDDRLVLKLTADMKVKVVAGTPLHCHPQKDDKKQSSDTKIQVKIQFFLVFALFIIIVS